MFTEKAFAGCAFNSKSELMLNGGYVPPGSYSDSTWYTRDGEAFEVLPPMPLEFSYHCAVNLENDDVFVTGGFISTSGNMHI